MSEELEHAFSASTNASDQERSKVVLEILGPRIAVAVESVFGADTAAGFIRGANPGLDDDSIAAVLSTNSPIDVEIRLVGVTRDFLNGS